MLPISDTITQFTAFRYRFGCVDSVLEYLFKPCRVRVLYVRTYTRGRVRAGPSLQLGTLSTRIVLYTRRWRASPGVLMHADYTLGAIAPLLACLYAHTFSGLAALCRMPKTKLIGPPVPEMWPNLARTDRHDLPTTNQPTNQPAVFSVPSCKLGIFICSKM